MPSTVMWKEMTAEDVQAKAKAGAIVVLPVASIEQHGPHLPVGVDTILCEAVCKAGAEKFGGKPEVIVAPTLWCGLAEHHMAFGGTFTFDVPTYRAVILAFLKCIERHGFKKVFIVNGHGGNRTALNAFLQDYARETGLLIRATTYFELAQPAMPAILEDQDGVRHACEAETSMMMVVAPATVKTDRLKDAHGPKYSHAPKGLPALQRFASFRDFSASGVIGDARRANASKGEKLMAAASDAVAAVLRDEANWR